MSESAENAPAGATSTDARPKRDVGKARASEQPFEYPLAREYVEPDWTRLPGYADVTREQWETAQWQRANTVKNLAEFKKALGDRLGDDLYADIERDQRERATMSMLIPPNMINTMDEQNLRDDPVRRYMAPAFSERDSDWPSHLLALVSRSQRIVLLISEGADSALIKSSFEKAGFKEVVGYLEGGVETWATNGQQTNSGNVKQISTIMLEKMLKGGRMNFFCRV